MAGWTAAQLREKRMSVSLACGVGSLDAIHAILTLRSVDGMLAMHAHTHYASSGYYLL